MESININNYPLKVQKHTFTNDTVTTRACTNGKLIESWKWLISQKLCINDATKHWNQLPTEVTNCMTIGQIKKQTKLFVKTLPI